MKVIKLLLCILGVSIIGGAGIVWFQTGAIHPCGILRYTYTRTVANDPLSVRANPSHELARSRWFDKQTPAMCSGCLFDYYVKGNGEALAALRDDALNGPDARLGDTESLRTAKKTAVIEMEKQRTLTIQRLREEADVFFDKGMLREPPEANALKRYQQLLDLSGGSDEHAKARLREIESLPNTE